MRKRTILSVAYPLARVGRDAVGGAEQVLSLLDEAWVKAGHRSLVIACAGSHPRGELIPLPPAPEVIDEQAIGQARAAVRGALGSVLRHHNVDLIHMHGQDFTEYLPAPGVPILVTLHVPREWYGPSLFGWNRTDTFVHCVSDAQRRTYAEELPFLPSIPNGVPVDELQAHVSKRHYAMCIGRVCPEKGYHYALDAAKAAQMPLLLGGEVFGYAAQRQYFDREIRPRLDEQRRYVGPLGFQRKRRLLAGARCLLAPSMVPETSSLVAMEAMACGTPVIGFPAGALADLIEPGRTGFLVRDEHDMTEALRQVATIEPAECRRVACERFSLSRMVERYWEQYQRVWTRSRALHN